MHFHEYNENCRMQVYDTINEHPEAPNLGPVPETDLSNAIIEFHATSCAVAENVGKFPITITRHGNVEDSVKIRSVRWEFFVNF